MSHQIEASILDHCRFTHIHDFKKPNDMQALLLMNECAKAVLDDIPDIIFAYGASDEYR